MYLPPPRRGLSVLYRRANEDVDGLRVALVARRAAWRMGFRYIIMANQQRRCRRLLNRFCC